jgi:hypothetical protein
LTLPLELMGAELIEMLVSSNTIVKTLNVIENFLFPENRAVGFSTGWNYQGE